jgi:hypothetical protein
MPATYSHITQDFGVWNISYQVVSCTDWKGWNDASALGSVPSLGNGACCPADPTVSDLRVNNGLTCANVFCATPLELERHVPIIFRRKRDSVRLFTLLHVRSALTSIGPYYL